MLGELQTENVYSVFIARDRRVFAWNGPNERERRGRKTERTRYIASRIHVLHRGLQVALHG